MLKRKPETLALIVALAGTLAVLVVFMTDLIVARKNDLDNGEKRLQHFSIMIAEHTARSFEALDILLREMATDLSRNHRNWEDWDPNRGWEYIAQHHSRSLPQLRDLILFDRNGNQRFVSTFFPPPQLNVKDRPYFIAHEKGSEFNTFGPFAGRNSNRYTYVLTRKISADAGKFAGVALAAIDPVYLQDFCWSNRLSDDFEAVLTNAKGIIIASCRPTDVSRHSTVIGTNAAETLFAGRLRNLLPETGLARGNGMQVSVSPVPGFPDLRVIAAIPEKSLLANWQQRLVELGTLASMVATILLVGGLLVRRQVRDMAKLTAELAASRNHLEKRVFAATEALASERDAAQRANTAKSRFLAAASHDLRQPLHALSLFAADLQRQIRHGNQEVLPALAEQINISTGLLGELLDSLLDISRLDVAGVNPEIRDIPLAPIFERLAEATRRTAIDRKQTLRFHRTTHWIASDPIMLERMIANLLSNALRYTPAGGRILVAARRRGDEIHIEIRDSGIGIAEKHQAEIFAEFYQVGNAAREHQKGLGLGLSIVDRLAKALKIDIALRSRLGEGTTFTLRVPVGHPEAPVVLQAPRLPTLHCFGESPAMANCMQLLKAWQYPVIHDENIASDLPRQSLIICDANIVSTISEAFADQAGLIVLGLERPEVLPPGAHFMSLPLKPAKLRALLNQLQNTFSKSIP